MYIKVRSCVHNDNAKQYTAHRIKQCRFFMWFNNLTIFMVKHWVILIIPLPLPPPLLPPQPPLLPPPLPLPLPLPPPPPILLLNIVCDLFRTLWQAVMMIFRYEYACNIGCNNIYSLQVTIKSLLKIKILFYHKIVSRDIHTCSLQVIDINVVETKIKYALPLQTLVRSY